VFRVCLLRPNWRKIFPPNASEWSVTTDGGFTVAQINAMEHLVLKVLNWNLTAQTPYSWLKVYIKKCCKLLHCSLNRESKSSPLPSFSSGKKHKVDVELKDTKTKNFNDLLSTNDDERLLLIDTLLSVTTFVRMMEILDMTLLDSYFLRFYPSALAASALCVVVPQAKSFIKEATGYTTECLQPCIQLLNIFTILPTQGLVIPSKPYFRSKAHFEEPYTRQTHHPKALEMIHELISRGYTEDEDTSSSSYFILDTSTLDFSSLATPPTATIITPDPHFSFTPTPSPSHLSTDLSFSSNSDLSVDLSITPTDSPIHSPDQHGMRDTINFTNLSSISLSLSGV